MQDPRPTYDPPDADACIAFIQHLVASRVADLALAYRNTGKVDREQLADTAAWAAELINADLDLIRGNLLAAIGRRADVLNLRTSKKY